MSDQNLNITAPPAAPTTQAQISPEVAQILHSQREELARLRAAQNEGQIRGSLQSALSQHSDRLVPGAMDQLATLLRPQIRLIESGGESVVSGPGLQPVGDFIRDSLSKPEYAHFQRAQNPGGGNGPMGSQTGPAPSGDRWRPPAESDVPPTAPRGATAAVMGGRVPMPPGANLSDVLLAEARGQRMAQQQGPGGSNPARNASMPFGLKGTNGV